MTSALIPLKPIPRGLITSILRDLILKRHDAVLGPNGDLGLITTDRHDLSDYFYDTRDALDGMGYDTAPINNPDQRRKIHNMVREICENDLKLKRHEIGIFAADRAQLAFQGQIYNVNLETIPRLKYYGTDIILVEKEGIVNKLVPFTSGAGIALLQSTGFVSEYAELLAAEAARLGANLAILTDFDPAGVGIGLFNFPNAARIGIDLQTVSDLGLDANAMHLYESSLNKNGDPTTHWIGLKNQLKSGKLNRFYTIYLREYLSYLSNRRIELNRIVNEVGAQAFWNWLKERVINIYPNRNYNRAIAVPDVVYPDPIYDFNETVKGQFKSVLSDSVHKTRQGLAKIEGLIEDTNSELQSIEFNLINNTLLTDKNVNGILPDVVKLTNKIKKMQKKRTR